MASSAKPNSESRTLFRHAIDRLPISLFILYFLLDVAVFFAVDSWWLELLWAVSTLPPKACICAWNHHQQHYPTFRVKWLNRWLEVVYAFQTGALPFAWTLHHVVGHHHNYLDQDSDESKWRTASGRVMGTHEYALNVTLTAYPRIIGVGKRFPRYFKPFLFWGAVVLALLGAAFVWNWINALLVFAIPMAVGLYVTAWHTYYHHAGLDSAEHEGASYNIVHTWYNMLTGNLGYHTAHHMRGGLHWSKLPAFHAKIQDRIPAHLYRRPCIPFRWMGADAYLPNTQVPQAAK